ncbi:MAG: sigma factor-like helix-turn-helix DNA-binding protein [Terracidiphilus sp.]
MSWIILRFVDTAPSESDGLELSLPVKQQFTAALGSYPPAEVLPAALIEQLWKQAEAESCALSPEDFTGILQSVGARVNYGLPSGVPADLRQKESFLRSLHLSELALAHACALGRESAWQRFLALYRAPLVQTAVRITNSVSFGEELTDTLYAELYGLRERNGERQSPLASFSGRGSLLSWLRATLVQRHRDHWRRTHRETPIDGVDCPAPALQIPGELTVLTGAIAQILAKLAAEDRFLLAAYYIDRQTLQQIGRTLDVHEATISRRLKRLASDVRDKLLDELHWRGLSKAAAKEALGADPRDLEINVRALLQTSQTTSFSQQRDLRRTGESEGT